MTRARAPWRFHARVFMARPRMTAGFAVGLVVSLVCLIGLRLRPSSSLILGWDVFCAIFLAAIGLMVTGQDPVRIARRAATQDEGQGIILLLVLGATAASLGAVGVELHLMKGEHGWGRTLHVALAVATVATSWLVMQTVLALHYAHEYYAPDASGAPAGGLAFPGVEAPDYWDFLHFAIIIGVASQTADIAFTSQPLRRIGTVHGVLSFLFNTVALALTINLLAGLF
jgi:uncharacterized membrane protein